MNRLLLISVFTATASAVFVEPVSAQFPGGGPAMPSVPNPGGSRPSSGGYRPSRPSPNPFGNRPSSPWSPNQPSSPSTPGRYNPNSPSRQAPTFTNPFNSSNGFRNPFTGSTPSTPGSPSGIDPRSNGLFPRPAVPVPQKFDRVRAISVPSLGENWKNASTFATQGDLKQAQSLVEAQLTQNRSLHNLMGAVTTLEATGNRTAFQGYRTEALRLARTQIRQGTTEATPWIAVAKFALEDGRDAEFRQATARLMDQHPDTGTTQLFYGIQQLKDGRWEEAEEALRRAEELGIPKESLNEYLRLAISGQKWIWEYALISFYTIVIWLSGILFLVACGRLLSAATLGSIRHGGTVATSKMDRALRRVYRIIVTLSGIYYYISLPVVVLLSVALPLSIGYGLLMLPSFSLALVALVLVAGVGGLLTAVSGIRAALIRIRDSEDLGRALNERDAPRFWEELRTVARAVGTRPVDEVWLTPGTDLAVVERGGFIAKWRDRGTRTLILGVGVLDGFRQDSFRAVLAHEYGHFAHRDTAGGDVALRVRISMYAFADRIVASERKIRVWDVAVQFLIIYHNLFMRLTFGASRLQEVLADHVAVSCYGAQSFCIGLKHVIRQSVEFESDLSAARKAQIRLGAQPAAFYQPNRPRQIVDRDDVEQEIEKIIEAESTQEDTHPSPLERFALAERVKSAASVADASPVWDLFENPVPVQKEMQRKITKSLKLEAKETRELNSLILKTLDDVKRDRQSPDLLFERARLALEIGKHSRAISDLEKVVRQVPDAWEARYLLILTFEEVGRYDDAIKQLNVLLKKAPEAEDDNELHHRMGRLQLLVGNTEVAIKAMTKVLKLDSKSISAMVLRAQAFALDHNFEEAIADCERAVKQYPKCQETARALRRAKASELPLSQKEVNEVADRVNTPVHTVASSEEDLWAEDPWE